MHLSYQERENRAFESLLFRLGTFELERRIQRRDITRKYYRRYPYDGWQKRAGMDTIDLVHPSDPHAELISEQAHTEFLASLTPRELEVAQYTEQGYKPREIAAIRGKATSNADRWIKHSVKLKFMAKQAEEREELLAQAGQEAQTASQPA